jgi:hypothetical protein
LPKIVCICGHRANGHGSERNDAYGCEACDCSLTREAARAESLVRSVVV